MLMTIAASGAPCMGGRRAPQEPDLGVARVHQRNDDHDRRDDGYDRRQIVVDILEQLSSNGLALGCSTTGTRSEAKPARISRLASASLGLVSRRIALKMRGLRAVTIFAFSRDNDPKALTRKAGTAAQASKSRMVKRVA